MIAKTCNDLTTQALVQLNAGQVLWHPCGSRYFGDSTDTSDFDFFTEHTEALQNYLATRGFKLTKKAEYMDVNSISIFEKGKVHAIFVRSVEARQTVQKFLKNVPKRTRKSTKQWDSAYKTLVPMFKETE